jgi:hypothetical protein
VEEERRGWSLMIFLLAQRAASEGPRWTRAVEDQSAPIPEEISSELGGIREINRDILNFYGWPCKVCRKKPEYPYRFFPNKALQPTAKQVPQFFHAVEVSGGWALAVDFIEHRWYSFG